MKKGWEYKTIKECCKELFAGGDVPKPDVSKNKSNHFSVPIYTNGVENEGLYGFTSYARVNEPAVTISARGTIGATFRRFTPFFPAIRLITAVPKKDLLSIDYLYYALNTLTIGNSGASIPQLTIPSIKNITLPIPPLSEQQSIVDYLDSAFAKIDAMKANAEKALNEAKALFQASLKEMLEPKEGWEEKTLKEVSVISGNYGLSVPSTEYNGIRYLRITDITEWGDLNDEKVSAKIDEGQEQELLEDGDILFARTGATVGKTLMYKDEFGDCLFAGYLIRYRLRKDIVNPKFMFYITHSNEYYKWILENQKAAAQPNISAKLYNGYKVSYPSIQEQQSIVTTLDSLKSKVDRLQENYEKISQECDALKQAILRQVFE